jgi:hypothetical protein
VALMDGWFVGAALLAGLAIATFALIGAGIIIHTF